jgi:monofunctional biosynthetic peptidoglycan transglycosylase
MLDPTSDNARHGPDDDGFGDRRDPMDAVENALFGEDAAAPAGGGELGRFRAGVSGPPRPERQAPLWRRILVFLLKWLAILIVAFFVLTTAVAYLFGWTGPPPTFNMASRAMAGVEVRREWIALKDVSPHLVRAVIAAEDTRFCLHAGFDMVEIQKAIDEAERGRRQRGASTISQQTAKNVFLFNGGGFARKGVEAWFTVLIETMWSKPRIMEYYLNVAEWGDGYFGAEAAAQARFGVSAKNLTSRQAALLAAVLPSPNRWKVTGAYANRRAGQIQAIMGVVRRDGLDDCAVK